MTLEKQGCKDGSTNYKVQVGSWPRKHFNPRFIVTGTSARGIQTIVFCASGRKKKGKGLGTGGGGMLLPYSAGLGRVCKNSFPRGEDGDFPARLHGPRPKGVWPSAQLRSTSSSLFFLIISITVDI